MFLVKEKRKYEIQKWKNGDLFISQDSGFYLFPLIHAGLLMLTCAKLG